MVHLIQAQISDTLCSAECQGPHSPCRADGILVMPIVFVGRLAWREHSQRTVSDQIRAISSHLFSNAPCLVWAMWGLFDKGRTILIEFTGSMAVHPRGRARTLLEGSAIRQETARAWLFILAELRGLIPQRPSRNSGNPKASETHCVIKVSAWCRRIK